MHGHHWHYYATMAFRLISGRTRVVFFPNYPRTRWFVLTQEQVAEEKRKQDAVAAAKEAAQRENELDVDLLRELERKSAEAARFSQAYAARINARAISDLTIH